MDPQSTAYIRGSWWEGLGVCIVDQVVLCSLQTVVVSASGHTEGMPYISLVKIYKHALL